MIEGANSATYTPVEDDEADVTDVTDVGRDLLAVVSYTDAKRNVDDAARDRAGLVSVNPVASGHEEQSAGVRRPGFGHRLARRTRPRRERWRRTPRARATWVARSLPRTPIPMRTR